MKKLYLFFICGLLFTTTVCAQPCEIGSPIPIVTGVVETWHAASLRAYGNTPLHVINTTGAIVHTQSIASPDETLHLGHLPAGMYIIRIENGRSVKTIKVIKSH